MTTELERAALLADHRPAALTRKLLDQIAGGAAELDRGVRDTRGNVELLARVGLIGLGAPDNQVVTVCATGSITNTITVSSSPFCPSAIRTST